MSQPTTWGAPQGPGETTNPYAPTAFAVRVDESMDALLSLHSGSTRPTYAVKGTMWLSTAATPNVWYFYDGAADLPVALVDPTNMRLTFLLRDGSAALPALAFNSDQDSGLYLDGGEVKVAFGGAHTLSLAPASNTATLAGSNSKNPVTSAALASGNSTTVTRLPGNVQITRHELDITLNASGDAAYAFPATFSARPELVLVSDGNAGASGSEVAKERSGADRSATGTVISYRPNPGAVVRRVNILAMGPKT